MSSEIISIERKYKSIKYEIKGRIAYKSPCGSYLDVDSKIYLSDTLLELYKEYPLNYMRVNHILGYKIRPCTTKVLVENDETDLENKEYKYITLRYNIDVNEEDKYLKVELYNSYHGNDAYIIEKVVLEVIDYLTKLKNKKGKY